MAEGVTECPKCRTKMEAGFVLDQSYGTVTQATWVEGAPEKSFWSGIKTKERTQLPLQSHRCPRCWYVEFYAPPV